MLSLYGALIGYTSFSRTLLINENYLPQRLQEPPAQNAMRTTASVDRMCPGVESRLDDGKGGTYAPDDPANTECGLPTNEKVKTGGRNQDFQQGEFSFEGGYQGDSNILVEDPNLFHVIEQYLKEHDMGKDDMLNGVREDVTYLQHEYGPQGRYGRDPERNPRDNASTLNHLLNLLAKKNRISKEHDDPLRNALWQFLSGRYK